MRVICANTKCGKGFLPRTTWARFCSTACRVKVWTKKKSCAFCSKRSTYTALRDTGFGVEVIIGKVCTACKNNLENKP